MDRLCSQHVDEATKFKGIRRINMGSMSQFTDSVMYL
jgi:hypothetical protein